jgi:hypothetical protein
MRDEEAPILDGHRLLGLHNSQQNDGVIGRGGGFRGDAAGEERVGRTFTRCIGKRIECRKKKNRESDGALDFDGFCWMRGRNNQPKVGPNDGMPHRVGHRILDKNNKTKFVMALGGRQSSIAYNNQSN